MMRNFLTCSLILMMAAFSFSLAGCKPKPETPPQTTGDSDEHDHEGHDHEGHDHEGHDHEGHDHEGHDHEGHDHEGHGHDEHGEESHPESYADAVKQLVGLHAAIRDAFGKNDKDAAHDPLHQIGHLLEDTAKLAGKASLGDEKLKAVKKATEDLMDGYGKIDGMFHGEKEVKYEDLAKELDAALAVIQGAVKVDAPKSE